MLEPVPIGFAMVYDIIHSLDRLDPIGGCDSTHDTAEFTCSNDDATGAEPTEVEAPEDLCKVYPI